MIKSRRAFFGLIPILPVALVAQQVNGPTQVKGLNILGDNWVPLTFGGTINGTNITFALQAGNWRKIYVFVNGVLQYQAAQVLTGGQSTYIWSGTGSTAQTITFTSQIPQPANGTIPADAVMIYGTL